MESYVAGHWFRAEDEGEPLLDAATGEEVARISTRGLDFAAMVAHARDVGGPALRALTFHERAGLLKALAKHLGEHKDEFYALSLRTGATQRDSMVDIDGGIGTVFAYASKGTRELPNDTVVLDGATEPLGRGGTFLGQHIYTSRTGVAVQINAFNFPVWGMLEKLAPAFLAGLPTIVKPASQTAYLTEAVVRRIIESGHPARGQPAAGLRQRRHPARRPRRAGLGRLHRLRPHRRDPAHPPGRASTAACGSASRPTRSTARSSAPTSPPRTPSSTCSSRASSPR